jgi:hypothetical protein
MSPLVASVHDLGTVPNPPGASGRDQGYSIPFGGHSVWIFGDTFFSKTSADGYHWRASTWSWTDQTDASHGLTQWTHALGSDNDPVQLLPNTADEQTFDDAHNGNPCPAGSECGARHVAWGAAPVFDPASGQAFIFYQAEQTEPTGEWSFQSTGVSLATWTDPTQPATRPLVEGTANPLLLFGADEPSWGAAALISDGMLLTYACDGGQLTSPCRLARVAVANAFDRAQWTFWNGSAWVSDWHAAVNLFDGAPQMTVSFNAHLGKYLAVYMVPLAPKMAFRTAPALTGPWSDEAYFGQAQPSQDPNSFDYALVAHPELAQDGGRIEYLSYYQPGSFLNGVIHLLQVTFK